MIHVTLAYNKDAFNNIKAICNSVSADASLGDDYGCITEQSSAFQYGISCNCPAIAKQSNGMHWTSESEGINKCGLHIEMLSPSSSIKHRQGSLLENKLTQSAAGAYCRAITTFTAFKFKFFCQFLGGTYTTLNREDRNTLHVWPWAISRHEFL